MPVVQGIAVVAGLEDHDDLFERAVAGALADAVDGAFDLARAGFDGGERVGDGEAEIVMAMDADDGGVAERFDDAADDFAVFFGSGVADRVGNVDGAGSGGDHGARDLFEIIRVGAGSVFGGKLDVVHVRAGEFDGGDGVVENLLPGFLELVLQVDIAGGDEGVNAGTAGFVERAGGALDVELWCSARARRPAPRGTHG